MNAAALDGNIDILAALKKHGVGLRDLADAHEPILRSCYGSEKKHTEAVAWFLDNGVPFDGIFERCYLVTTNDDTKELLQLRKLNMEGKEL